MLLMSRTKPISLAIHGSSGLNHSGSIVLLEREDANLPRRAENSIRKKMSPAAGSRGPA